MSLLLVFHSNEYGSLKQLLASCLSCSALLQHLFCATHSWTTESKLTLLRLSPPYGVGRLAKWLTWSLLNAWSLLVKPRGSLGLLRNFGWWNGMGDGWSAAGENWNRGRLDTCKGQLLGLCIDGGGGSEEAMNCFHCVSEVEPGQTLPVGAQPGKAWQPGRGGGRVGGAL